MTDRTVRHKDDGPPGYTGHGVRTRPGNEVTVDTDTADALLATDYFEAVGSITATATATDADDSDAGAEICGTEMADGSVCERPAGECPYHGD